MDPLDLLHAARIGLPPESGPAAAGHVVRPDWVQMTNPHAHTHFRNGVKHSELADEDVDARVSDVIAQYAQIGVPFRWIVGPRTRPADMAARLLARGFEHFEDHRGMVLRLDTYAPTQHPGVRVERIGAEQAEVWVHVCGEAWGMPAAGRQRFRNTLDAEFARERPRERYYLAYVDGEPVGTAAVSLHPTFAGFSGAAVLPAARRRGVYRATISQRVTDMRERGYAWATILAVATTSAPICERVGFDPICTYQVLTYGAG